MIIYACLILATHLTWSHSIITKQTCTSNQITNIKKISQKIIINSLNKLCYNSFKTPYYSFIFNQSNINTSYALTVINNIKRVFAKFLVILKILMS